MNLKNIDDLNAALPHLQALQLTNICIDFKDLHDYPWGYLTKFDVGSTVGLTPKSLRFTAQYKFVNLDWFIDVADYDSNIDILMLDMIAGLVPQPMQSTFSHFVLCNFLAPVDNQLQRLSVQTTRLSNVKRRLKDTLRRSGVKFKGDFKP